MIVHFIMEEGVAGNCFLAQLRVHEAEWKAKFLLKDKIAYPMQMLVRASGICVSYALERSTGWKLKAASSCWVMGPFQKRTKAERKDKQHVWTGGLVWNFKNIAGMVTLLFIRFIIYFPSGAGSSLPWNPHSFYVLRDRLDWERTTGSSWARVTQIEWNQTRWSQVG